MYVWDGDAFELAKWVSDQRPGAEMSLNTRWVDDRAKAEVCVDERVWVKTGEGAGTALVLIGGSGEWKKCHIGDALYVPSGETGFFVMSAETLDAHYVLVPDIWAEGDE
jgi:hypothetical protein